MTKLFGIMAALAIIVISASAAGQLFFESPSPRKIQVPEYEISKFRISSFLPFSAYRNLPENLTQEFEDVVTVLDAQLEQSRSDDITGIAKEESETASADAGVISGLVTNLVPAAQTKRLVATVEDAQDTVTGAIEFKEGVEENVEKAKETISKKRAFLLAIYSVWRTAFTNVWPFMRRISSAIWNVANDGSHYSPPENTGEAAVPSS